jgi:hypothetical protein
MSDTLRTYRNVRRGLDQRFSRKPTGRLARSVDTLAWMITGIVRSCSCQLPWIATHLPGPQRESQVKKLSRFVQNERIDERCSYVSFAKRLLKALAKRQRRMVLVMDGSEIGRNCRALVISVLFGGRALPLGFLVERGNKGHFSQDDHLALLKAVQKLLPSGVTVTFLSDGHLPE